MKGSSSQTVATVLLLGVVGLVLSGCSGGRAGSPPAAGKISAGATAPVPTTTSATATAKPTETKLPVDQFGSARDRWHKMVVSVTVRGDSLVVRVKTERDLTSSETAAIMSAASAARKKLKLDVTQVLIIDDETGNLLSYGPVG